MNMYKAALLSQGAVNVGALIKDLARYVDEMRAEPGYKQGTDYVNNHPVMKLFLEQAYYMCRIDYSEASDKCTEKSD